MARMRAQRRPFTAPRAGRLLSAIEFAFFLSRGEPISTTELVRSCYPAEHIFGGLKSWHRGNVIRAARLVAEPIGRASTRGRPLMWREMPERMKARALAQLLLAQRDEDLMGRTHGQFWELGVDLLSPALNFRIPCYQEKARYLTLQFERIPATLPSAPIASPSP
jgi:hypothetical protein